MITEQQERDAATTGGRRTKGFERTHGCGELRAEHAGTDVVLCGWVYRRRDHGGLIFIDLRDGTGFSQVVFHPDEPGVFEAAEGLRAEYVVRVRGTVRARPEGMANPGLATGEIEVAADGLEVLNRTARLPILVDGNGEEDEVLRLRYRYLELRRPHLQRNIRLRHRAAQSVRRFLSSRGFLEVETPTLTRSTPEGARDYLVPSRHHPGTFYALPQSPQLFKQLLVISGFERYFQLVRCYRDEDQRADRQPEFTQIDIEMAFVEAEDVMELTERMMTTLCGDVTGRTPATPFPRLTCAEALERYGTDKPDTRFGLELVDVSDLARDCPFKVFSRAVGEGGRVKGIRVPGHGGASRKRLDELSEEAVKAGAGGLVWLARRPEGLKSPLDRFLEPADLQRYTDRLGAESGDLCLFCAGPGDRVAAALDHLRRLLGRELDLIDRRLFNFLWVVEPPLFEPAEEQGRLQAVHHPFTSPLVEDEALLSTEPLRARARAYDLVLNGVELGSGSIRVHRRDLQTELFRAMGIEAAAAEEKFGFLLRALELGAPPHGGIALGFDRILMLLCGAETIRDVIAFPKTATAACPLTGAPAAAAPEQLAELGLELAVVDPEEARGDGEQ